VLAAFFMLNPVVVVSESTLATFAALQARATSAGIHLRQPPPEPTTCCGRGCNGCVWEGFYEAAHFWEEDALAVLLLQKT
jgi:hypothetical protein